MNNKLFLGLLIGFVILLVIFIIIVLTTEDNNNLIKSIGSSILILFGGSIIGYTTCSKNNKCKCGSYENCICGTNEIKGSGVFDWISEKFFGNKNNTQKEVEINNLNQMLKATRNGLDSINNEYIFLKNENLNSIMQSNISIKQKYFDKINKIENNADTYNFQNILYLQLIFNSMAKNDKNQHKDKLDKHLNKLTQEDKKRLEENINMFKNDTDIDIKNRKKITKEYLKLLDKAETELQMYKDLELAKKTPLPDDKMLVRVTIPKKNKKIVINMINKLKNDIPMLEENDIPMLEENNLKNKIVDSISKYEVRTPTEWKNIKIILKHDSEIEQKITPDIINKIIDYISEFEENNPLPDDEENDILEEAKNTPLPDDEENLSYDIPISDNILNPQLTNEMKENNINNQRVGFRPVSVKDFENNAKKNKNQYIDNTLNNTLKKVQETKELIQVQENVQNVQETIEYLINKNEQLNNDKMNIFNTEILPEFEKNLQTLNSLVKINKNKLKNIDELNNYIEEIFQWKENEIININNDNIDIMDYATIRINNKILDKINEVNNILKENRIEQYKNKLDLKDNTIEQTNIVQTDNLQKINAIEKEKNKNNLQVANVLKDLKIQIENNTDLNDDNINEISESISEMITNIEKEQNENKAMAIEEKEMWEFIIKREDEKFNTDWNLFDDDDDGVTPIAEKAKYFWKPSSIKELPNNLNILDNNIKNKIKENTTQIKENINNIITYNCNSITNLFNTINDEKIPVVDDAKLKMITEIYSKINSKDMNIKDCKFIEDNLTEINRLIDFYNKNKKEDKLNKISIKDGKINIDSPAKSPSSAAATTPTSESPPARSSGPSSANLDTASKKLNLSANAQPFKPSSRKASDSGIPASTPALPSTKTVLTPTKTIPVSASTPSSSLGSSLPTNLSGLPIIAPALKYKESEKRDTNFDKYLAKLLSSSI